ncbi:hypothetical protein ACFFRR_007892 [Megaselia abdita]
MIKYTVGVSFLVLLLCTVYITADEIPPQDELGVDGLDIPDDQMILHKRPAFFLGSRYGRSSDGGSNRKMNIVQRNDRFFIGSRYGKRSKDDNPFTTNDDGALSCVYTGVLNLFECKRI